MMKMAIEEQTGKRMKKMERKKIDEIVRTQFYMYYINSNSNCWFAFYFKYTKHCFCIEQNIIMYQRNESTRKKPFSQNSRNVVENFAPLSRKQRLVQVLY